ncbi:hypothetical protein [Psychromonas sp. Urea-02u-13]|uniref:hypothetical protein n=1 Tax=Psychromonas sp. Urea-02u-13 TaxID=2058326 RepID=UPI000C34DB75|nr:hypothetical protein [Psychromonas sp. Urea-02u-13]PKG37124.1 hypothetical protein CXF74_20500 [Psychromonas sp. Urea-02u-13]
MLNMIMGHGWATPGELSDDEKSNKRKNRKGKKIDDMHDVKKELLKDIGKSVYSKLVGDNPDIKIDKDTGNIILDGQRARNKGDSYHTEIHASGYFVRMYFITELDELYLRKSRHKYHLVPRDIDYIYKVIKNSINNKENEIVIVIK